MALNDWKEYIKATKSRKPNWFLIEVVESLNVKNGFALDLGCGSGMDSKYMAENGFNVVAIDSSKNAAKQTKINCKGLQVEVTLKDIADYKIEDGKYNLIICWNALPFLVKNDFIRVLEDIQKGLKKEGYFFLGLFGPEDDWAKSRPEMSFCTVSEIKKILNEVKFIKIIEEKETKPGATGKVKFWHQIKIIAQKT